MLKRQLYLRERQATGCRMALWNCRQSAGLDVRGNGGVLSTWLDRMHVQWS